MNWSSWIFCLNRPAAIGDRKERSYDEPNRQGFVHRRGSHYRWTGRPEAASALLQDVVGKAKSPCRLVYGVASLPLGAPVELEVIFELAG